MKQLVQAWQDNDAMAFLVALGVAAAVLVAVLVVRFVVPRVLRAVARRAHAPMGESAAESVARTRVWLMLPMAFAAGATALELAPRIDRFLHIAAIVGVVVQVGLWITHLVREWVRRRTATHPSDGSAITALALLGFAARVLVWALVLLFILDQMGFNITALVAGLGIGGVAVALAVQNILGDLFASLSIVLDKPFVIGDFIVVDDLAGTVERIGVKSTRLRSLGGEGLVFSNSELLKSRIRNFKRMAERRVVFGVGLEYGTPPERLREVPGLLRAIVEAQEDVRFDRAHFKQYGDSSLDFEVVFYVLSPDFNTYMDRQQAINFAIFERFSSEGLAFAFPTRTVHVASLPEAKAA